jgi:hypothetical protein
MTEEEMARERALDELQTRTIMAEVLRDAAARLGLPSEDKAAEVAIGIEKLTRYGRLSSS